jgi:hypothetical protein
MVVDVDSLYKRLGSLCTNFHFRLCDRNISGNTVVSGSYKYLRGSFPPTPEIFARTYSKVRDLREWVITWMSDGPSRAAGYREVFHR